VVLSPPEISVVGMRWSGRNAASKKIKKRFVMHGVKRAERDFRFSVSRYFVCWCCGASVFNDKR